MPFCAACAAPQRLLRPSRPFPSHASAPGALTSPQGMLTERQAAQICRSLVLFLAHCHLRGVAHMDIKPENIMFDSEGAGGVLKVRGAHGRGPAAAPCIPDVCALRAGWGALRVPGGRRRPGCGCAGGAGKLRGRPRPDLAALAASCRRALASADPGAYSWRTQPQPCAWWPSASSGWQPLAGPP
jgi:serine/threonine protein kinase